MTDSTVSLIYLTNEKEDEQLTLALCHSQKSPAKWENLISKKHRQYIDEVEEEKENRYNFLIVF